jgi:tungstate transport system ATP-binding protein
MRDGSSEVPPAASAPYAPITAGLLPLDIRGIGVIRDGKSLLDDVSVRIAAGPPTVIMGHNGAGKSLLVRVLHGLVVPTRGTVVWGAGVSPDVAGRRSALVFQRPTLLNRSALANIAFVLSHRPRAALQHTAQAVLDRAGLGHLAATPARQLSGGEQQRLAMARALASSPEVLFLDEPTASLDPAATAAVERMINDAVVSGTKVILVTHDVGQARRLAGDVVFLARGRVAEIAPASSFFGAPVSTAAKAYLAGELEVD